MKKTPLSVLIVLIVALSSVVYGQETGQTNIAKQFIRLQVATFDPLVDGEPPRNAPSLQTSDEGPYYIVQFNGPVDPVWVAQIERLGGTFVSYVPDNAHIIRIDSEHVEKIRAMYAVRWLGSYQPAYKLAPALATQATVAAANSSTDVYVVAFPGESLANLQSLLLGMGASIRDASDSEVGVVVQASVPTDALPALTTNPAISWIEPFAEMQLHNLEGRRIMNVENVWQNEGFFGEGQIVAISDSGLSVQGNLDADFAGRLVRSFAPSEMNLVGSPQCAAKTNWTDLNGHGTHVAGSVLGNGTNSGSNPAQSQFATSHAGAAPKAQVVFMALNTDGSLGIQCISTNGSFVAKGYENGARISSNSWGGNANGSYGLLSSIVDNYIWNNKDYLVLFSAGNSGPGATTIGSPGTAKNVLTIGASENNRSNLGPISDNPNEMADFSSRGPTTDGRIKPDVVAPGTRIISVLGAEAGADFRSEQIAPNSSYAYSDGTSMATPLAAGASTLVREWLGKQRGMPNPSAAFLKALMIHGAFRLPGAGAPDFDSGWGRVDVKNTLGAKYALFDDHVQGLTTGQKQTYTVEVLGSNGNGMLYASQDARSQATHQASPSGLTLINTPAPAVATVAAQPGSFRLHTVPGYDRPLSTTPIPTGVAGKAGLTPVTGRTAPSSSSVSGSSHATPANGVALNSFLHNVVGGGDFEDPAWTDRWEELWLGYGIPTRTDGSDGGIVIDGNHSLWLGGTPSDDSFWYPLSFPEEIDTAQTSAVTFNFQMRDLDIDFDQFCVALTDVSGFVIGNIQDCYDDLNAGLYKYTRQLTEGELAELEGETGYLVLYTEGDGIEPHLSTFVDNVVLDIDLPDATLEPTPEAGPPGTRFLLFGENNIPYGRVQLCIGDCSNQNNVVGEVYADARGEIDAYVEMFTTAPLGQYEIQTLDAADRKATTTITLIDNQPTLSVSPQAGPAGTHFTFEGAGFTPNDTAIKVSINGEARGVVIGNADGTVNLGIRTSSNTAPGSYTVEIVDSKGRSASATYQVTGVPTGSPTMTVSPGSGAPGTTFTFEGSAFAPNAAVAFSLDGQSVGQTTTNGAGSFQVTLQTSQQIAPATYTLIASQGNAQASAEFTITGNGGDPTPNPNPSGNGLYVTLVWTDPPAQTNAAKTLINNLNLRIDGPNGAVYLGNGGTSADDKNNVEAIRLENPAPGTYTITVEGASVNGTFGSQPFALLATTGQNFGTNSTNVGIGTGSTRTVYLPVVRR